MKILVIDDDKAMRDVLIRSLSSFLKFDVFESEDAQNSIEILSKERPDIVFLDMQISGMDASAILGEFKKITPDVRVVFMTGFGSDEEALLNILKQDLTAKLNKPFKLEELRAIVEKLLNIERQTADEHAALLEPSLVTSPRKARLSKDKRRPSMFKYVVVLIAIVALIGLFFGYLKTQRITPISFDTLLDPEASPNISYITTYENFLYIADWMEQKIYVYQIKKSIDLIKTYKLEKTQPTAICVISNDLWVADSLQGSVSRYRLEKDNAVFVKNYKMPGPAPAGIYLDGQYLWSYDIDLRKIYKHNIENNLTVIHSYDMPVEFPCGFTKFKGSFYLGDTKTNRIFKLSREGLNLEKIYVLPQYETSKEKMIAFGSDNKSFWSASENGKIYRHDPKELKSVLR